MQVPFIPQFPVSSEECLILMGLEQTRSAVRLAKALRRDPSVISRQLTALGRKGPWVEKIGGKWQVTGQGRRLVSWAGDALEAQRKLLESRPSFSIVTAPEFAARVVAPGLGDFPRGPSNAEIRVVSSERGMEPLLLSGEADLGIGCGNPQDPSIRFQKILREPYVAVASPRLLERAVKRGVTPDLDALFDLPHVRHLGIDPSRELGLLETPALSVIASFGHVTGARAAACAGLGWAILPRYAVLDEIERGLLREIPLPPGQLPGRRHVRRMVGARAARGGYLGQAGRDLAQAANALGQRLIDEAAAAGTHFESMRKRMVLSRDHFPAPGSRVPDFSIRACGALDGARMRLSDLRGRPVALMLRSEAWDPSLEELLEHQVRDLPDGVGAVLIADPEAADALFGASSETHHAEKDGARAMPRNGALLLVNPDGRVLRSWSEGGEGGARGWPMDRREFLGAAAVAVFVALPRVAGAGALLDAAVAGTTWLGPGATDVTLEVNGKTHYLKVEPRVTLLDALRERMDLTGSKKGCDHGQCGACTVLVDGRRINSCLVFAIAQQGKAITTIEGLGRGESLHPMQQAFLEHDGFQCGFCTPGQVMSAVALLGERCGPSDRDVREHMSGNICRCGAYDNIVAAVQSARKRHSESGA